MIGLARIFCIALLTLALRGESLPGFEVASIKPFDRTGMPGHGSTNISGPRVSMANYTLSGLIQYAYDIRSYQLSGGPNWMATDAYSITAKAEGDTQQDVAEVRKMVQRLLAERFGLKVHPETKEVKVYLLVPAKTGPTLTASIAKRATMQMGGGRMVGVKFTVTQLAALLASAVNRPVLDKTGLTGEYDFTLESPDINMGRTEPVDEITGPSIFTAIQEQLGLKLEPSRGPVETLVIDHAEKPAGN
jgi:uncharacterized protein (TIGR03435 family)